MVSPGHVYSLCDINSNRAGGSRALILSLGGKFLKGWMWFSIRMQANWDTEPAEPKED